MTPLANFARRLALAALVLALAGCSITRPAPVKQTFLLEPDAPAAVAKTRPGTLRIGTFSVAEPFRDRPFVYRTGELQYESDFYSEFFIAPAPMIAQATARSLRGAKVFASIVPAGVAPEDGDYVLEAFVSELYADTRGGRKDAVVGITFYVSRLAFPSEVVWQKAYRERVPLAANTPEALAAAWNSALGKVLADLAGDLAAADLKR